MEDYLSLWGDGKLCDGLNVYPPQALLAYPTKNTWGKKRKMTISTKKKNWGLKIFNHPKINFQNNLAPPLDPYPPPGFLT